MRQTSTSRPAERIPFVKMEGLGNDFVVVDARERPFDADPERIRQLADRRSGIGFDQLLVVEPAAGPDCAFAYRIWNADGGEAGQCGNGARCLAWLWSRQLSPGATEFTMQDSKVPPSALKTTEEPTLATAISISLRGIKRW